MKTTFKVEGLTNEGVVKRDVTLDTPILDLYNLDQFPADNNIDFRDYCPEMGVVIDWVVKVKEPKKKKKKKSTSRIVKVDLRSIETIKAERKKIEAETEQIKRVTKKIIKETEEFKAKTKEAEKKIKQLKAETKAIESPAIIPAVEDDGAKKFGRYQKLMNCTIIGYIDYLGVVHSVRFNTKRGRGTHTDIWGKVLKGWDWDYNNCLDSSIYRHNFDKEDWEKVRKHLTKKYGVQWQPNGYHDWKHIGDMADKEGKENNLNWRDIEL